MQSLGKLQHNLQGQWQQLKERNMECLQEIRKVAGWKTDNIFENFYIPEFSVEFTRKVLEGKKAGKFSVSRGKTGVKNVVLGKSGWFPMEGISVSDNLGILGILPCQILNQNAGLNMI